MAVCAVADDASVVRVETRITAAETSAHTRMAPAIAALRPRFGCAGTIGAVAGRSVEMSAGGVAGVGGVGASQGCEGGPTTGTVEAATWWRSVGTSASSAARNSPALGIDLRA